jgi:hypothetical protein
MKIYFKDLVNGEKFHDGKSRGSGINKDIMMWMEFEKISKSQAKCINQIGYDNNRWEGKIKDFAPFAWVWKI